MKRTLSLVLLTSLFALSGIAWCSVADGDKSGDVVVVSHDGAGEKAAKVPADGGGASDGIIKVIGATEHGDTSDSGSEGDSAATTLSAAATTPPVSGEAAKEDAAEPAAGQDATQTASDTEDKSTQTDDFGDEKININTASAEDMVSALKGIGPKKAQAIIDYREAKGPFTHTDQLKEVKGIGPSTFSQIKELIIVE
ncbi:ComEA family DNA-binding protein [Sodalis sp. C49]|uniref:ComEA family DNA-binding protein n=1 Tax=unclassified Sodalis (in: enterobacteria) TaxID=2636512 RepID=UPI003965AA6D